MPCNLCGSFHTALCRHSHAPTALSTRHRIGASTSTPSLQPYMPDRYFNNTVVEDLNKIAIGIMQVGLLYHCYVVVDPGSCRSCTAIAHRQPCSAGVLRLICVRNKRSISIIILQERNIPIADLYHRVTDKCGDVYKNCSICDDEYNNVTGAYLVGYRSNIITLHQLTDRRHSSCPA